MKKDAGHIARARLPRRGQTEAETALWFLLRNPALELGKWRRQHPLGPYVVNFVCLACHLIVEVDGGQHNDEVLRARDEERTVWLKGKGYCVPRFWSTSVFQNLDGVLLVIQEALKTPPHPNLLPLGEKGSGPRRSYGP